MDISDKQIEDLKVGDYVGIENCSKRLWRVQHINFDCFGITRKRTGRYMEISSSKITMIVTRRQREDIIHSECHTATRIYEEACLYD